jgi:hypothetical protein
MPQEVNGQSPRFIVCLQLQPQTYGEAEIMTGGQGGGRLQNLHAGILYQPAHTRMSLARSRNYVLMQLIASMQELQFKAEM